MAQPAPSLEWTQSYKDQPHKTGFLDLPREIRDYVYRFAFQVPGAIFIYAPKHHTGLKFSVKAMNYRHRNEGPNEPQPLANAINIALLRTCRQLHAECSPVLYGDNVFRVWFLSDTEIMPTYRGLVHHILYSMQADSRIYKHNLDEVQYGWKRKFWPGIVEAGMGMLMRFPALETLTIPISPFKYGQNWTPAFFDVKNKTRQQRIDMAARWMKSRCPFEDERLRTCLHLELTPAVPIEVYKDSIFYDRDDDYEVWDVNEFSEAFQIMKDLR